MTFRARGEGLRSHYFGDLSGQLLRQLRRQLCRQQDALKFGPLALRILRACACLPRAPATTVSSKPAQGMNSRRLAVECLQELGRPTSVAPLFGRFSVIKSGAINLGRFGPARPSSFHPGAVCFANLTVAFLPWHTTLFFAVLRHTPESGQAGHRRGLDTRV